MVARFGKFEAAAYRRAGRPRRQARTRLAVARC